MAWNVRPLTYEDRKNTELMAEYEEFNKDFIPELGK